MRFGTTAAVALLAGLLSACAQAPVKPAESHLRAGEPRPEGSIPPPVQMAPVLPRPKPSVRPETYSVVVSNVRVQELLFALARDARLNVDISPDITGTATLNAIDKTLPAAATAAAIPVQPPPVAPGPGQSATAPGPAAPPAPTYQEAASVIANRESGVLYVRATSKQHEKVQEFLDQVMAGAKRQVLVEATVAEVQLRNEYQRGIEWQRLRSGPGGFELTQPGLPPPTGFNPNPFVIGYVSTGNNFSVTLKLLEQFGDVRVLSSPKLSVMNNQTAILRVTRDIIYFTITPSTQPITFTGGGAGGITVNASFTTTPNVAAEGFMMAVLPQINETDGVVLNVRPTIRRQVASARDPNPALQGLATQNDIPLFETREFDSILRLQSGEIAVLAGLMQDQVENTDAGIPGIRSIPLVGEALSSRSDLTRKTELVIFLRASVIRDPSTEGDFRRFRDQLPGADFFTKPNPGRIAPPVGPAGEPLR